MQTLGYAIFDFPTHAVTAVFDGGLSSFRSAILPEYKQNRYDKDDPETRQYLDTFRTSKLILKYCLERLGIRIIELPGKEADDVLLRVRDILNEYSVVVTEDRDLLQLVDSRTLVWRPAAGELIGLSNFTRMVGVRYENFLLYKAVAGDAGDNIPGIPGVGKVTVGKVVTGLLRGMQAVDIPRLLTWVSAQSDSRIRKITEHADTIRRNLDLVDVSREPFSPAELAEIRSLLAERVNVFERVTELIEMFQFLEFREFLKDFNWWIRSFAALR